jgi:PAS domain S-box-containing protein
MRTVPAAPSFGGDFVAMNSSATRAILRIVLLYLLVAGLWIQLSDRLLEWLLPDQGPQTQWSIVKGWGFVVVTGVLLAVLLRRELTIRETTIRDLQRAQEETARLNRALRAISECKQTLIHASDQGELLDQICRIATDLGGYRMAWVGYIDQGRPDTVHLVAQASKGKKGLETSRLRWTDGTDGIDPVGTALLTGRPSVVRDVGSESCSIPWLSPDLRRELAAVLALPLKGDGQMLGALCISSHLPDAFDEHEIKLLSELADDLASGVAALRARQQQALAETALRESEARLRSLGDNLPNSYVYVYTFDPDGVPRFLYLSAGVEMLHGVKADEVLRDARLLYHQIAPEDSAAMQAAETATRRDMDDFRIELRVQRADGQWRWLKLCSRPRRTPDGQVVWDGVATDITPQKEAETELLEREKLLRDMSSLAQVGGWEFDVHTGQGTWTDEVARIHDMEPSQTTSLGVVLSFYQGESREIIGRAIDEAIELGKPYDLELEMLSAQGRRKWVRTIGQPIREGSTVVRVRGAFQDVTERRQAEAQIRQLNQDLKRDAAELEQRVDQRTRELTLARDRAEAADRTKSAFLATMSHELRTPLNSVIGFSGLLLQGLAGPLNDEQIKQLGMIKSSGQHLLALINDVLDISKIEAGEIEIDNTVFDLRESIQKVMHAMAPLAEKKHLSLTARLAPDVGPIVSDRRRVEQIVINLLSNAVKFTDRGEVTLVAETGPAIVSISVCDTGLGIQADDLAELFQPFHQLDTGLRRRHEGTGLGLAICKRLVDRLGGAISVESEFGKGSTFRVTLPGKGPKSA